MPSGDSAMGRKPAGGSWRFAGRAGHWWLIGLLAGLLCACAAAAAPPPPAEPEPVVIVVGIVTEPVRWLRPERGSMMIDTYDGLSFVSLRATTPIRLRTIGRLQPLGPAGMEVGDHVTIRVAGVILESSPSQMAAAEIIVIR